LLGRRKAKDECIMKRLHRFWWRHFGAGRHFWRDLYLETAGFRTDSAKRVKAKSTVIRSLRNE